MRFFIVASPHLIQIILKICSLVGPFLHLTLPWVPGISAGYWFLHGSKTSLPRNHIFDSFISISKWWFFLTFFNFLSLDIVFLGCFLFPPEKLGPRKSIQKSKVTELEEMTEALMLTFEVGKLQWTTGGSRRAKFGEVFWVHGDEQSLTRWCFQTFYFHHYLGKWSNLTNIFQMGWNHQLD